MRAIPALALCSMLAASVTGHALPGAPAPSRPLMLQRLGDARVGSLVTLGTLGSRRIAWVSDEDDSVIHCVDLDAKSELSTTRVDGRPGQMVITNAGRLAVTLRDRGRVELFEPVTIDGTLRQVASSAAASEPVALSLTPDDATLLATSGWGHELAAFDARDLTLHFRTTLAREPRAVIVSGDGSHAFITHTIGGAISVVDLSSPSHEVRAVALKGTAQRPSPAGARLATSQAPVASEGFALTVANGRVFAPVVLVDPGNPGAAGLGYYGSTTQVGTIAVLYESSAVALGAPLSVIAAPTLLSVPGLARPAAVRAPDCLLPRAAVTGPDDRTVLVTCLGVDALVEYDATAPSPRERPLRRWPVPPGSVGLAIDSDRKLAVVWSQFTHDLALVSLRDSSAPTAIPLSRTGNWDDVTALGRRLFHAAGDPRLSLDGRACASCHVDGRDDGLVWATPEGPRQTPMLAGRVSGTAPYGWAGRETTLREYLVGTVRRLGGSGLSDFDRDALAAYVSTVRPPVVSRSTQAAVERGSSIFHSPSVGCSGCHRSDGVFADGDQHAIGSEAPADRTLSFDTPSLRFVGGTPPYFHDGRYPTLHELLARSGGMMGHTKQLSQAELDSLEAYLRSL